MVRSVSSSSYSRYSCGFFNARHAHSAPFHNNANNSTGSVTSPYNLVANLPCCGFSDPEMSRIGIISHHAMSHSSRSFLR